MNEINDILYDEILPFLDEYGAKPKDVMHDNRGYFILVDGEVGLDRVSVPDNYGDLL